MSQGINEIRLMEYERSIFQLRNHINNLEEQNRALAHKAGDAQLKTNSISRLETNMNTLNDLINFKDDEIMNLKNDLLKLQKDYNDLRRNTELKYEKEIKHYKNYIESNATAVENSNRIFKLNELQDYTILKLRNDINDLKEEETRHAKETAIKHENQFTNLKKKMMDHIKSAQKNMAQANLDNMDLNTKLTKLTTNQLLIELEEQSMQIEELIKEKEKFKKIILSLKTDINTHKKVEQLLQEKNQKYFDMIKNLNDKNTKQSEMKNTISSSNGFNANITEPNQSYQTKKIFSSQMNFEDMYHKKSKQYENLKGHYECLRDKQNNYEKKYANVLRVYKKAFDNLMNDNQLNTKTDLHINIDTLFKGDFETSTKEQQYTILVYLIKHVMPLIHNPDDELDGFQRQIGKINMNMQMNPLHAQTHTNFRSMKNKVNSLTKITSKNNYPMIQRTLY